MITNGTKTHWARIYIAGPLEQAEQICREYVQRGACVNVSQTNYIFKYGEQSGVVVEFINYPRFPRSQDELFEQALELGTELMNKMCQGSFTVQTDTDTVYFDRRDTE